MDPSYAAEIVRKYPDIISGKCYLNRGLLGYHFVFVTTFFALAIYLVYFRFRAFTPENPTLQKLARNKIYKACGIVMFISCLIIGFIIVMGRSESIFWPETFAVAGFAIAWLIKGQTILKDSVA
jgi:hypothetical protein